MEIQLFDFASDHPEVVLTAVQAACDRPVVTHAELASAMDCGERRMVTPFGAIHPAHVPWIAGLLKITTTQVTEIVHRKAVLLEDGRVEAWKSGKSDSANTGVAVLRRALQEPTGTIPEPLGRLGVQPTALVLNWIPVIPAGERQAVAPFPGAHPVTSAITAGYLSLMHYTNNYDHLMALGRDFAAARAWQCQDRFEALVARLRGEPFFESLPTERANPTATDRPSYNEMPSQHGPAHMEQARHLLISDRHVLVSYGNVLVHIDSESGAFRCHQSADRFSWGPRMRTAVSSGRLLPIVYDLSARAFATSADWEDTNPFVLLGDEVHDLRNDRFADLPWTHEQGAEVVESPCGRYAWFCSPPEDARVGFFSIAEGQEVFNPWPHLVAERRVQSDDQVSESEDLTPRALARTTSGDFRWFYGGALCQRMTQVDEIETPVDVAAFSRDGDILGTISADVLRIYPLDESGCLGAPRAWSLAAVRAHLGWNESTANDEYALNTCLAVVGSVGGFGQWDLEALKTFLNRFGHWDNFDLLDRFIATSKGISLPTHLERLDDA